MRNTTTPQIKPGHIRWGRILGLIAILFAICFYVNYQAPFVGMVVADLAGVTENG